MKDLSQVVPKQCLAPAAVTLLDPRLGGRSNSVRVRSAQTGPNAARAIPKLIDP